MKAEIGSVAKNPRLEDLQKALNRNFFRKELSLRKRLTDEAEAQSSISSDSVQNDTKYFEQHSLSTDEWEKLETKQWISLERALAIFDETFAEDKRLFSAFVQEYEKEQVERNKRLEQAFQSESDGAYDEGYDDCEQGEKRRTEVS